MHKVEGKIRHRPLVPALLVLAAATAPAMAQDPPDTLEEIIVTAQRRSENLQKVPIAVTPVSMDQIETAGITSSLDLPRIASGVTTAPTAANSFFIPYIRGVGSNSPATGNDSSIAVYIDGIYQSDKAANVFDFSNIERIEVLKGPQGTLFGRNATGGAINVITLKPQVTAGGNAELSYARFDRWTAKGHVTGPLSDTIAASLSYQHIGGGDYFTNTGTEDPGKFGGTNSDAIHGKLLFRPGDNFDATLGLMYVDRSTTDLNSNLAPVPGTTPVGMLLGGSFDARDRHYAGSPNQFATEAYRASLQARWSLDKVDLVSITGYVHTQDISKLDYDGTTANVLYFDEIQGTKDFSQELQLLSADDGPLQWVLGAYYFKGKAYIDPLNLIQAAPYNSSFATVPAVAGGSITSITADGPTRALAGYGQATFNLTDATRLTGGLRYTSERRRYDFAVSGVGQIAPGFASPVLIPLVSDQGNLGRTFDKLTWRLALDQQFTPDIMGYVSWNRGFKSGTFNMNDFTPGQTPVKPEVLDAYETGLKGQFMERRLQINLAAFYYDYRNIQLDTIVAAGSGASTTVLQNAANERIYGLDADLQLRASRGLQLRASATLLDAEYKDFPNATAFIPDMSGNGTQSSIDASGTRGLYAPRWSFTLGADYTADLANGGELVFSGSYYRTASFKVGIGPADKVDEYDSLGASVTYRFPENGWYVRGFGNNLTDRTVIGTNLSALKQSRQQITPLTYGLATGVSF